MTCTQYGIKDADQKYITQEKFENFLITHFPDSVKHGSVMKFLDKTLYKTYEVIERIDKIGRTEDNNLGKIILEYTPTETILSVKSFDPVGLVTKLMSKNSLTWIEKKELFKHQ